MTLTVMSPAGPTVSTGLVLNRRSVSAEKYWIGPIHFLLDRAFSSWQWIRYGRCRMKIALVTNQASQFWYIHASLYHVYQVPSWPVTHSGQTGLKSFFAWNRVAFCSV